MDFAGLIDNWTYLIIVDAHSNWPEAFVLRQSTTTSIMAALDKIESTHVIPETLVSDNGTQFTSSQFTGFSGPISIGHTIIPPCHSKSNGQNESFMDTFRRAMVKANGERTSEKILYHSLLFYFNKSFPCLKANPRLNLFWLKSMHDSGFHNTEVTWKYFTESWRKCGCDIKISWTPGIINRNDSKVNPSPPSRGNNLMLRLGLCSVSCKGKDNNYYLF